LQRDQQRIADCLTQMAQLAARALDDGMTALRQNDRQLAYAVIIRDQAVDVLEREVARLCLEFLVRQQPAGMPLRFAYAAIKINSELERVGDYAESIAHQAAKLASIAAALPLDRFQQISDLVLPMLRDAVRAFLTQDAALARATIPIEDTIDGLKSRLRKDLAKMYKDNQLPFEALDPCLTITRRLERVSDQARNICVEALYLCTGEFANHAGAELYRVLFVDDHNSCRSQIAEAIGRSMGLQKLLFDSAGLDPKPIEQATVDFMRSKGVDLSRRASKAIHQVPDLGQYHVVIALSGAVRQAFPPSARKLIYLDWAMDDPSQCQGTGEQRTSAYENAYQAIRGHLEDLVKAILGETTK
jgi:phosphate transport system protein